jgi:hypothetical protein
MFQENVVQPLLVSTSAINMATETVLSSKDVGFSPWGNFPMGKSPKSFTKVEKVIFEKSNGHVHFGVFNRDSLFFWRKLQNMFLLLY